MITLIPSDEPGKIIDLMAKTGHTGFPIVDNGRLVGIVTNRDVTSFNVADKTYPVPYARS